MVHVNFVQCLIAFQWSLLPSTARPIIVTYGSESQLAFYIYICSSPPPGQRYVFKMASLAVTWMPSLNL